VSQKYHGQTKWQFLAVTDDVLETVKQACLACTERQGDVFFTNLRDLGTTDCEVISVIHFLVPDLSDTASLSVDALIIALNGHIPVTQAA